MSKKIGVMVDSFRIGVIDGLDKAKDVGADAVQIYVGKRDAIYDVWTPEYRAKVKAKLDALNLKVSAMCGDLGGHGFGDTAENAWKVPQTIDMLPLCRDLGCDIMTTHIGVVPDEINHPRRLIMVDALKTLTAAAEKAGVRFAIETGPETPETLKSFIEQVGSPNLGVNYDPANLKMVLGVDNVKGVHTLKGLIFHTHAKDGIMVNNVGPEVVYGLVDHAKGIVSHRDMYRELPLGEGDVEFPGWIAALRETGYEGYFTIEREVGENPEGDIRKAVAFLENLL